MKKPPNTSLFHLLLMVIFLVFASSCEKDEDTSPGNPTNGKTTAVFNPDVTYGTMTDQDGNTYKTVTIGTQTWMAENLRTTKYNDGTAIPHVPGTNDWNALTTEAYCNYGNVTNLDTIATYGRLYNWYAVSTGKLAPKGWHVATNDEWTTLIDYVGGEDVAGEKLRESGKKHWQDSPYVGGINEFGFTSLPGGSRDYYRRFDYMGSFGFWWTASEYDTNTAWLLIDYFNDHHVYRGYSDKEKGHSVRCVKN